MDIPFFNSARRRATVVVVTAIACAASGLAVAAGSGDGTKQRLARSDATRPTSTPSEEANAFGVLRSPTRTVRSDVKQAFAHAPQYDGAFAPNASLAQPLAQDNPYTDTKPWVVPADDGLCLFVPDTEGAATTCSTLDEAKAGDLHLVLGAPGKPSVVVGVVPDGVDSVQVTNADGSADTQDVTGNSYAIRSAKARSVKVGSTVVKVPQAPKSLPGVR